MFRRKNGRNILGSDEPGRLHFQRNDFGVMRLDVLNHRFEAMQIFLTLNSGSIVDGDLIVGHKDV